MHINIHNTINQIHKMNSFHNIKFYCRLMQDQRERFKKRYLRKINIHHKRPSAI